MKRFIQIILLLFTVALPQFRKDSFRLPDEIVRELARRKIRKRKPKFRPPIARWRKARVHPKYKSSKPRDHRFSDHQRLRRMYRKY